MAIRNWQNSSRGLERLGGKLQDQLSGVRIRASREGSRSLRSQSGTSALDHLRQLGRGVEIVRKGPFRWGVVGRIHGFHGGSSNGAVWSGGSVAQHGGVGRAG